MIFELLHAGCSTIYLDVLSTNDSAIKFYENNGWYKTKYQDSFYLIKGKLYNAYKMRFDAPPANLISNESDLLSYFINNEKDLTKNDIVGHSKAQLDTTTLLIVTILIGTIILFFTILRYV